MITEKRHQYILDCLKNDEIVQLRSLIAGTGASESTLRRDLQELEDENLLQRIHGGAKRIISLHDETTVPERLTINSEKKDAIAKLASSYINNGDIIFLDSGTSTKALVKYLTKFKDVLVITNSIDNASLLADYKIKTFLPGGLLKDSTKALVGSQMMESLKKCHFDIAFIGTNGFDLKSEFTTPDIEEAAVKNLAITNSKKAFILADSTKYSQVAFCKFASFNEATLITEGINESLLKKAKIDFLEA